MRFRQSRRPIRRRPGRNVVVRSKFRMERRQRALKAGQYLLIAALAGTLCWWSWRSLSNFFLRSEHFKIKTIEVRGGRNVSESEIIALLPFRTGDNLFQVWLSDTEKTIARCKPELKRISLGRRWQKIVIDLKERVPVACVVLDGQRLGLDADNVPFPLRGRLSREFFPEVASTGAADREVALRFIREFAPEAEDIFPRVARLSVEPVNNVVLELKDGSRIYWGPLEKDRIGPKRERLAQVLEDSRTRFPALEYINLRYFDDGRIIVKPRSAAAKADGKEEPSAPFEVASH